MAMVFAKDEDQVSVSGIMAAGYAWLSYRDAALRFVRICPWVQSLINDIPPGSNAWADKLREELSDG